MAGDSGQVLLLSPHTERVAQGAGCWHASRLQPGRGARYTHPTPALAFVHPYDIHELFAKVAQQLPTAQATELVLYFERTYIGRTLPGGTHQAPLFPLNLWNYYYETPFGLPRTTNAVEAWHRSFNATVGCHHPSIWKFIAALKREQGLVEVRQAKFIAGAPPTKRKRAQASEQALVNLVAGYYHRTRVEFLRLVTHHSAEGLTA